MKRAFFALIAALSGAVAASEALAQPAAVTKTNPLKVYMHYMPWFETPATLGGNDWGFHWEMENRNPNVIDANGKRQIASHYYPKIGPYSSRDPHVIEYHMLLMKYAGVDGVLINWYGQQGTNGDIGNLLTNSNAIVNQVDDYGMQFGVVLEDRFAGNIEHTKANVRYLRDNYFNRPAYIRQGAAQDPLMAVFGPITFQQPAQWTQILAEAGEDVNFVTLWYEKNDAGASADGEYAWIYQDAPRTHYQHQSDFYVHRAPTLGTAGGSAYPGFKDYYQEGGVNTNIPFEIPHLNGDTLASLLTLANSKQNVIDFLQLNTWNDFGEGTMFEPTVETGYSYLEQLQGFTGVPYGKAELELVYRLYRARKEFVGDAAKQALLDQAASNLAALNITSATQLIEQVSPAGDLDNDGDADGSDFLMWQRQLGSTGLYPEADQPADANGDGVVNGADLDAWKASLQLTASIPAAAAAAASSSSVVPEPAAISLFIVAWSGSRLLQAASRKAGAP